MLYGMNVQIAVRLAEDDLRRLDAAIARGAFPSRAAAVRFGLGRLLREERDREIAETYRRAYAGRDPDHEERVVGELGLRLGKELLAADDAADG